MNKLILILPISLILSGCFGNKDNKTDINAMILEKKAAGFTIAEKISELNKYEPINYEAFDQKSPFEKYFDERTLKSRANSLKPDFNRPKEYLERFDLTQLNITGVLNNKKEKSVIIFDGKTNHILKVGNHLGNNFGKIVEITENSILIDEIVKEDGINSWVKKRVEMKMTNMLSNNSDE